MPKKPKDEIRAEMEHGDKDEEVYTDVGLEKLKEDDEIETWEEGFMEGANEDGKLAKCAHCGEPLMDGESVFETKVKGKLKRFCSDYCLETYKEEHGSDD